MALDTNPYRKPFASAKAFRDPREMAYDSFNPRTGRVNGVTIKASSSPQTASRPSASIKSGGSPQYESSGAVSGGGSRGSSRVANPVVAESDGLRNEIASRRSRANAIFSALTNAVQDIANERVAETEADYGRQVSTITSNQEQTNNDLTAAYGGRGLKDSSYRINAVDKSAAEAQGGIEELGRARSGALAKIGEYLSSAKAKLRGSEQSVNAINLDEIGNDPDALKTVRDRLDDRLRELDIEQASTRTDQGFMGTLNSSVPQLGNVSGAVKNALDGLLKSALPQTVKASIASGLIGNLDPDNKLKWEEYYRQQAQVAPVETLPSGG